MPGFDDDSDELTFVDLFRTFAEGMYVLEVLVMLSSGGIGVHYMLADTWRRLLYLGAGEMREEWITGLLMIVGKDLRYVGDPPMPRLDQLLRNDLRILQLCRVRRLMRKAPPAPTAGHPKRRRKNKSQSGKRGKASSG